MATHLAPGRASSPVRNSLATEVSMNDFEKVNLNDAEIQRVVADGEVLLVFYKDWQETERQVVFNQVAGYQWCSPEGRSLSHGQTKSEDQFISFACEMADEDTNEGFRLYSFVSAWNDAEVLRVVAKGFSVS